MDFKDMLNKALEDGTKTLDQVMTEITAAAKTINQEQKVKVAQAAAAKRREDFLNSLDEQVETATRNDAMNFSDTAALLTLLHARDSKIAKKWNFDKLNHFFNFTSNLLKDMDFIFDEAYKEAEKDLTCSTTVMGQVLKHINNKSKEENKKRDTEGGTDRESSDSCVSCSTKKSPNSKSGYIKLKVPESGIIPDKDWKKINSFFEDIFR